MFSSLSGTENTASPANNTRGRRRQRPLSSDNSVQQPKAKRLRVPLTGHTFVNPDVVSPENYEVKSAQTSMVELRQDGLETPPQDIKKDLSFRSKKSKTGERLNKGDGSVVLVCQGLRIRATLCCLDH